MTSNHHRINEIKRELRFTPAIDPFQSQSEAESDLRIDRLRHEIYLREQEKELLYPSYGTKPKDRSYVVTHPSTSIFYTPEQMEKIIEDLTRAEERLAAVQELLEESRYFSDKMLELERTRDQLFDDMLPGYGNISANAGLGLKLERVKNEFDTIFGIDEYRRELEIRLELETQEAAQIQQEAEPPVPDIAIEEPPTPDELMETTEGKE
jgi:hypothetical protein